MFFSEGGTTSTVLEHTFRMQNALLTSRATRVFADVRLRMIMCATGFTQRDMRVEDVIIMYVRCDGTKKVTAPDSLWGTNGF